MTYFDHERVVITKGRRSGIPVIIAVHSTALGQAVGGCRMWNYSSWRDGLEDALLLSEAMTLKCAMAGVARGGGKSVIALPVGHHLSAEERRAVMLDLGDTVDGLHGMYGVAEDVGTTAEDMFVVAERTRYAYCLPVGKGGSGEPSEPTAVGVYECLRATCEQLFGTPSVAGRHFVIVGVGQVGSRLARRLAADGASLTVSDLDESKQALAAELGAVWAGVDGALFEEADIVVPAALGGVLNEVTVDKLRCRAVVGPANNQLASEDIADRLAERGILWGPDFVVNAGGVIFGAAVDGDHRAPDDAMGDVVDIGATLRKVYATAAETSLTPFAAAVGLARDRVAAAQRAREQAAPA